MGDRLGLGDDVELVSWRDLGGGDGEIMFGFFEGPPRTQRGTINDAREMAEVYLGENKRFSEAEPGVSVWMRTDAE